MYKPINGYTKKEILWYLKTFNNGTKSMVENSDKLCAYESNGNHCAVGCFIPHGHDAMKDSLEVVDLLTTYKSLAKHMPLSKIALMQLQRVHDTSLRNMAGKNMKAWVEKYVTD